MLRTLPSSPRSTAAQAVAASHSADKAANRIFVLVVKNHKLRGRKGEGEKLWAGKGGRRRYGRRK
jgi:hypothetical protein